MVICLWRLVLVVVFDVSLNLLGILYSVRNQLIGIVLRVYNVNVNVNVIAIVDVMSM